jgi:DNA relaxase NicK
MQQNIPDAYRIEVGIDYMTSTSPVFTSQAEGIMHYGQSIARTRHREGHQLEPARILGFDGFSSGTTVFYGQSNTTAMLRIAGEDSDSHFKEFNQPDYHYTRLDIQVTCWCNDWPDKYEETCYDIFKEQFNPEGAKNSGPRITRDAKGGWTVYSAARTAKQMARIYNKYAETPEEHYRNAIRFELELKDTYASEMANMLQFQGIHANKYILSYLKLWFSRKGIILPYNARTADISLLSIPHIETDTEKKLQWLERQVRPTVQRLIDQGLREYVTILLFGSGSKANGPNEDE